MMKRAYSTLEIKAVEGGGDKRRFTGIATTPTADRVGDIVEPKGAMFKLPIPLLWQHDHRQPIGWVTSATVTAKGIEIEGEVADIPEDGKLKDRLQEAWQSIKHGLVRGLSIGFSPIESADIQGSWAQRFLKWEWLELSAVTIAANSEASIQTIKSIDTETRAALGLTRKAVVRLDTPPGVTGTKKATGPEPVFLRPNEGNEMKTIAEQIAALEATRASKAARAQEVMQKSLDEGRSTDAAEAEEFDTLEAELKTIDEDIVRLKKLEKMNVANAAVVNQSAGFKKVEGGSERVPVNVKNTEKLEPGIEFARFAMCMVAARGDAQKALQIGRHEFSHNERIVKALDMQANSRGIAAIMKANVNAGTTLDSTWAAPLVDYQTFAGDFVEFLRPQTIIGKFGRDGIPALRSIPFNVNIKGQTSGGSAGWVGQGAPKPLTKFDFNEVDLSWAKIAAISVLTEELIRFSNPSAERLVRDALAGAIIERMDIDFVDPDKAAVSNVSPASITNGVAPISAAGSTDDQIRAALKLLWAPFIAANNPPTTAVYIMSATLALSLSLRRDALGNRSFPGITMMGGTFEGVPVIVSEYVKNDGGSAGGLVILVNASDIWLADDGQVTIDASREASLQMDDAPSNNSATGTESQLVSMWQTNSVAIRAERYINWQKRRNSAVAYLDAVTW